MAVPLSPTPLDPAVARAVALLDDNQREAFHERAAIIEFDAGLPRAEAERRALADVRKQFGLPAESPSSAQKTGNRPDGQKP